MIVDINVLSKYKALLVLTPSLPRILASKPPNFPYVHIIMFRLSLLFDKTALILNACKQPLISLIAWIPLASAPNQN